ncbi:MAG TPA: NAD+ synthase [Candidatus Hypogeohydataceae bacterium YC41]
MKIALAQINPTVAAFKENAQRISSAIEEAKRKGADMVVFPEMSIVGSPAKDLLEHPGVIQDNLEALERVAVGVSNIAALIGFVDTRSPKGGKPLYNAGAFIMDRKIFSIHHKFLLSTYDVFDEARYFESDPSATIIDFMGRKIGITIGEEFLKETGPTRSLIAQGARLIINMSAFPYSFEEHKIRLKTLAKKADQYNIDVVYVNMVGGNDELIYEGGSCFIDNWGRIMGKAKDFEEDLLVLDLKAPLSEIKIEEVEPIESVYKSLVLGLRDYARKCGFKAAIMGLSGGIDSSIVACLSVAALGKENVTGVSMPSQFSSKGSVEDARKLTQNMGIPLKLISIQPIYERYMESFKDEFKGLPSGVAEENLQARIRGTILMTLSNKYGHLLVATGNKSELACGYCTLYGDLCGGFAVMADVPKTMVYQLAHYINREKEIIPKSSIEKVPSAELRPNQTDQDTLPPYPILDGILKAYIEEGRELEGIVSLGYGENLVRQVIEMVDRNEYKRKQSPPGLRITSKAFGSGRRMPIAQHYRY